MTRLGQMIMDDGIKIGIEQGMELGMTKGIEQGIDQGTDRAMTLTEKLISANRVEDCKRATKDKQYREQLMKELGIK